MSTAVGNIFASKSLDHHESRPAMLRRSCSQPLSNHQIWIFCLQSLYRAIRSISLELRQSKRLRSIRNHHMTHRSVRQHSSGTLPLNLAPTSHTCIIETHDFALIKMFQDRLTARGSLEVPRRLYHGRVFLLFLFSAISLISSTVILSAFCPRAGLRFVIYTAFICGWTGCSLCSRREHDPAGKIGYFA